MTTTPRSQARAAAEEALAALTPTASSPPVLERVKAAYAVLNRYLGDSNQPTVGVPDEAVANLRNARNALSPERDRFRYVPNGDIERAAMDGEQWLRRALTFLNTDG